LGHKKPNATSPESLLAHGEITSTPYFLLSFICFCISSVPSVVLCALRENGCFKTQAPGSPNEWQGLTRKARIGSETKS
jgi:hypothetical protein